MRLHISDERHYRQKSQASRYATLKHSCTIDFPKNHLDRFRPALRIVNPDSEDLRQRADVVNTQNLIESGAAGYHLLAGQYQRFHLTHPNTHQMIVESAPLDGTKEEPPAHIKVREMMGHMSRLGEPPMPCMPDDILRYRLMGACFALLLAHEHARTPDDISSLFPGEN